MRTDINRWSLITFCTKSQVNKNANKILNRFGDMAFRLCTALECDTKIITRNNKYLQRKRISMDVR